MTNPFITFGYDSPETFCARENETQFLLDAIANESDVTVVAPHRYGMTTLLRHALLQLPETYLPIYISFDACADTKDFVTHFSSQVIKALNPTLSKAQGEIARHFSNYCPVVESSLKEDCRIRFDIPPRLAESLLETTTRYISAQKKHIIIVFEDFQECANFSDSGVEQMVADTTKACPHTRFIFCMTQGRLTTKLLVSAQQSLFQGTQLLTLGVIPESDYYAFASRFFTDAQRRITREAFHHLYETFNGITWYMQMTLNYLWSTLDNVDTTRQINDTIHALTQNRTLEYRSLMNCQPPNNALLLKAIAKHGPVREIMSGAFLDKSGIRAASSARAAYHSLMEHDLLFQTQAGVVIYNRLFKLWLAGE